MGYISLHKYGELMFRGFRHVIIWYSSRCFVASAMLCCDGRHIMLRFRINQLLSSISLYIEKFFVILY